MRGLLIWFFTLFAAPSWADGLPQAVLKQLSSEPGPFLDLAADLIHGYGGPQGIDLAGVDRFVALERAEARASALRQLAAADLDFDGAVSADELAALAAAASAKTRGRLWALHQAADQDGNRVVSAAETAAWARAEAMRLFSPAEEAVARAVLTFDADANGWVTLEEVKAAVAALAT